MEDNPNIPVLIVDDDANLLKAYSLLLSRNGFKVTCTESGIEAIALVKKEAFALILLDVMLPDISGLEVLKIIKSNPDLKNLFVVLISSLATSSINQSEGLEIGADGYITIPVENREFLARIEGFVRHKRTMDKLRASEEKWHSLVDASPDYIALLDDQARYLYLNHYAEGFSEKDVIGNEAYSYILPESIEIYKNKFEECMKGLSVQRFDFYAFGDNRQKRIYDQHFIPMKNKIDEINVLAIARDITDSKQAEEALKENERLLRESQAIARLGSFVWDLPVGLWKGSEILEDIFGIDEKYICSFDGWANIVHPDWRAAMTDYVNKEVLGKFQDFDKEYQIIRQVDRQERWVHGLAKLEFDKNNHPIKLIGTISDITGRKQMELALQYSEKRFRSLIENSADSIVITDEQGIILYESPGSLRISGRTTDDRIGRSSMEFLHPGDRPAVKQMLKKVIQNPGREQNITVRYKHADGSWHWQECTLTNQLHEPAIKGIVINVHDITRQTQDRDAMRMSEAKYRGLFEANKDGIAIFYVNRNNSIGNFVEVNTAAAAMLGYSKKEMLAFSVLDLEFNTDEYRQKSREQEILENGFANCETQVRHKNGSILTVELLIIPIRYNDRIAMMNIVRDITGRKRSEEALRISEEKFRNVFDFSVEGKSLTTMDGRMKPNKSFCRILGYTEDELSKLSWQEITHKDDIDKNEKIIQSLISCENEIFRWEKRYIHKNGSIVWVDISTVLQRDNAGNPLYLVTSINDITGRKLSEAALRESHQQLLDIIDFLPDATFVVDKEKKVIAWNKAMEQMTGVKKEEMIGKGNNSYTIPFYGNRQKQILDFLDTDGEELNSRYYNIRRNGLSLNAEIFAPALYGGIGAYITCIAAPLFNSNGERVGSIESIRDITDHKHAEDALRKSKAQYDNLVSRIPVGIYILHSKQEGSIVLDYVSPRMAVMLKISIENALADATIVYDSIHPDDRDGFVSLSEEGIRSRRPFDWKGRCIANGEIKWLHFVSSPELLENGDILWHGLITDITERKHAEDALQESESHARAMLGAIPDMMFRIDRQGVYLDYRADMSDLYTQSLPTIVGRRNRDITPPEFADLIDLKIRATLETGILQTFEYQLEIPVKGVRDYEARMIASGADEVTAIVRDITDRKKAEDALRVTNDKLNQAQHLAQIGSWENNLATNDLQWSVEMYIILGFPPDSPMNLAEVVKIFPPEELERLQQAMNNAINKGTPYAIDYKIVRSDGSVRYIHDDGEVIRDEQGKAIRMFGTTQDITDRKQAEKAILESAAIYSNLVERLPDGVYKSTHDGKFVDVNPAMVKMLGYSSKEELMAIDIKTELYFESADRESLVLQEEQEEIGVYRLKKKDGSEIWLEDHGWFNTDDIGQILFHEGIMRDVTERKRAQDEIIQLNAELEQRVKQRTLQLENINKELESFSYSVSHDLRAPLRGIDGWSLALLEDYNHLLDSRGRQYLERVRNESQRMGTLIDDLLKLSRISSFVMKKVDMDFSAIAQNIANRLLESNTVRQCEFIIQPGVKVNGDPQMLEIALTNMLDNAFKFTGKVAEARIEFGLIQSHDVPTYFVKDNGVGFDMEYSKKLFGAFQRMHKQSEFPGSGIGLATVQRIISRHEGRIWAESKPGEGATFFFCLNHNPEQ